MKKIMANKSESGFSLVELMIVVGIIGVLATLALPRFKQFQAKAKMGEAKNILSHLYTLEQSYALDKNEFIAITATVGRLGNGGLTAGSCTNLDAGARALGFRIDPCDAGNNASPTPRYGYTVPAASVSSSTFTATATSGNQANNLVCPGNPTHTFTVDQANLTVEPVVGTACAL